MQFKSTPSADGFPLTPRERESIRRVLAVIVEERDEMEGTETGALLAQWLEELRPWAADAGLGPWLADYEDHPKAVA